MIAPNKYSAERWPVEIRLRKKDNTLEIKFDDNSHFELSAELLRVESPSAEVQGHTPEQKQIVTGQRNVGIIGLERIGNYAIRIKFDDLHETGIFSWQYLYHLGCNKDEIWKTYRKKLETMGLSRDS